MRWPAFQSCAGAKGYSHEIFQFVKINDGLKNEARHWHVRENLGAKRFLNENKFAPAPFISGEVCYVGIERIRTGD
jgi:hypothetical protein